VTGTRQVFAALARALMLDGDATAHLQTLARAETVPRRRPRPRVERVRPGLLRMMEALAAEVLTVNGVEGQQLVVYHTEPGSRSERALNLLAAMIAEEPAKARHPEHQH